VATGSGASFGAALLGLVDAMAGHKSTYTAKNWHAQLSQLSSTARGRAAADAAGLAPSRRTYLRWLAEEQTPTAKHQAQIRQAYEAMARRPFPDAIREGNIKIYGKVGIGDDVRDRGAGGTSPFLIDASEGNWDALAELWDSGVTDPDQWEALFVAEVFLKDIETSDPVTFPGDWYTVTHS
jgi:hypothetical protein